MQVPKEFIHLVHCFHQDMMFFASTEEGWVANALKFLRPVEKQVVKRFLTELLARDPDIEELQEIWDSAGPDWEFKGEGLRYILAMIRDRIE